MKQPLAALVRTRLVAEIIAARHGAWPIVFIASAIAVGLAAQLSVVPLREDTHRLQVEIDAALSRGRASTVPPALPAAEPDLRSVLLAASSSGATLNALFDLARKHQLRVQQSEYQRGREAHAPYETMQASLALSGAYPSIRLWLEEALRTFPHVSVDQIGFERTSAAGPQVLARVKVTLWLAPESAPRTSAAASLPASGAGEVR